MTKAIAYYNVNLATNVEILDIEGGERVRYRINNDGKKRFSKVDYNQKGEPYFIERAFTNSRVYLSECLRTNI